MSFSAGESGSIAAAEMTSVKSTQSPRPSFMICDLLVKYRFFRLLESFGLVFVHVHFFRIRTTIASVDDCAASSTSVNNNAYTARPRTLFTSALFFLKTLSVTTRHRAILQAWLYVASCLSFRLPWLFSTTIQTTQRNTAPTISTQPTGSKQPRSLYRVNSSLTRVSMRR